MPKPPDTNRKRRAAGRGAWVALALAGAVALTGLYLWAQADPAPAEVPRHSLAEALADAGKDLVESLRESPQVPPADAPALGSMQANLLSTSAGDRNHLLWRTISEAGFACHELKAASPVGSTGSAWRANCGETHIYLIEVGEFGRLTVAPMPFNDTLGPTPIRVMPDEQERTLQFREP